MTVQEFINRLQDVSDRLEFGNKKIYFEFRDKEDLHSASRIEPYITADGDEEEYMIVVIR